MIEPDIAEPIARAVGFRNLLVHGYADVDGGRVVAMLDSISDLESLRGARGRATLNAISASVALSTLLITP